MLSTLVLITILNIDIYLHYSYSHLVHYVSYHHE